MASEKFEYSIKPIMEIQKSFLNPADNGYQSILEELKKSKEMILKLEIQLKAANDTIAQQIDQLVKAKTIISQFDKLEGNSRQTIDKLKEDLEIERRGRRTAEEKVQQLGEQLDRMKMLTKVEMKQDSHKEENMVDNFYNNSMETDDINCDLVDYGNSSTDSNKCKENDEVYSSTVIIGSEVYQNLTENDQVSCSPGTSDKNSSFRTELQRIESTLLKYVNRLVAKENKPYKRQKCLNKVIRTTEKLVGSLSAMVSEEWLSYKLENSEPSQPPLSPLPSIHSPIQLWNETSTESTPAQPELNLPSCSTTHVLPEKKSENRHEMDMSNSNKCTCGHESTNPEALVEHVNQKVTRKLFKCKLCGHLSMDTSALNLHMQRVHSVKSDYANGCGKCGKTFATKGNLRKHMSLHPKSGKMFDASAIRIRVHH